jgi:hypothetical protein
LQSGTHWKSFVDAGSEQHDIEQIHPDGQVAELAHETIAGLSQNTQE